MKWHFKSNPTNENRSGTAVPTAAGRARTWWQSAGLLSPPAGAPAGPRPAATSAMPRSGELAGGAGGHGGWAVGPARRKG